MIPLGLLVTVPVPLPAFVTVRVKVWRLNVAVQFVSPFRVTDPVVQPVPLQPAKTEPAVGVAVKVMTEPLLYDPEQAAPQSMPEGELLTVPVPVPAFATVRLNV